MSLQVWVRSAEFEILAGGAADAMVVSAEPPLLALVMGALSVMVVAVSVSLSHPRS
ncbi:hypothetical protein OG225_22790 [Nocardia sp. NBC_01377]|uniref:hypothetical protein n=1 Tax=Nocardia sp. NBC_01377 TaxID=2903595 RepID=UPI0032550F8E